MSLSFRLTRERHRLIRDAVENDSALAGDDGFGDEYVAVDISDDVGLLYHFTPRIVEAREASYAGGMKGPVGSRAGDADETIRGYAPHLNHFAETCPLAHFVDEEAGTHDR